MEYSCLVGLQFNDSENWGSYLNFNQSDLHTVPTTWLLITCLTFQSAHLTMRDSLLSYGLLTSFMCLMDTLPFINMGCTVNWFVRFGLLDFLSY